MIWYLLFVRGRGYISIIKCAISATDSAVPRLAHWKHAHCSHAPGKQGFSSLRGQEGILFAFLACLGRFTLGVIQGDTLISIASHTGNVELLRALAELKADIHARDKNVMCPVYCA